MGYPKYFLQFHQDLLSTGQVKKVETKNVKGNNKIYKYAEFLFSQNYLSQDCVFLLFKTGPSAYSPLHRC